MSDGYDYEETAQALQSIGISICPVVVIGSSDWDSLTKIVGDYVEAMYPDRNLRLR